MACLHEEPRVDGRPQVVIGRKIEACAIPPVECLGRIFDRQQLDTVDPEPRQPVQLLEDNLLQCAELNERILAGVARHPLHRHLVDHDGVVLRQWPARRELIVPAEGRPDPLPRGDVKHAAIAAETRELVGKRIGHGLVGMAVEDKLVLISAIPQAEGVDIDFPPAGISGLGADQFLNRPSRRCELVALRKRRETHFHRIRAGSGDAQQAEAPRRLCWHTIPSVSSGCFPLQLLESYFSTNLFAAMVPASFP